MLVSRGETPKVTSDATVPCNWSMQRQASFQVQILFAEHDEKSNTDASTRSPSQVARELLCLTCASILSSHFSALHLSTKRLLLCCTHICARIGWNHQLLMLLLSHRRSAMNSPTPHYSPPKVRTGGWHAPRVVVGSTEDLPSSRQAGQARQVRGY